MSEQGKNNAHEEMEICTDCCMRQSKKDSINLERYSQKIEELRGFITTAETAATEYAQQAAELRSQELRDLEITINEILPVELQRKWGLEKLDHARNVQHIFMRACCAIVELEKARGE